MGGIVIAAGGTGGHIYPALAVASELKSLAPEAGLLFVGVERGMGAEIVKRAGFPFAAVAGSAWRRGRPWTVIGTGMRLIRGAWQARRLLSECGARVVFSTGGYAAAPGLLAALIGGVPFVLHEPDAVPGTVNRLFGRWAKMVTLGSPEGARYFRSRKCRVTGVPVRSTLLARERAAARQELGLAPEATVILVLGGSQGARPLNQAMVAALPALARDSAGLGLVWICGEKEEDSVREAVASAAETVSSPSLKLFGYLDDIGPALAASDIVLARAGASSLAEILSFGIPSVLVPYPHATADHQSRNAKALEDAGAAQVLVQGELSGQSLAKTMLSLINDPERRSRMAQAAADMARPNAAREIAQDVLSAFKDGARC